MHSLPYSWDTITNTTNYSFTARPAANLFARVFSLQNHKHLRLPIEAGCCAWDARWKRDVIIALKTPITGKNNVFSLIACTWLKSELFSTYSYIRIYVRHTNSHCILAAYMQALNLMELHFTLCASSFSWSLFCSWACAEERESFMH